MERSKKEIFHYFRSLLLSRELNFKFYSILHVISILINNFTRDRIEFRRNFLLFILQQIKFVLKINLSQLKTRELKLLTSKLLNMFAIWCGRNTQRSIFPKYDRVDAKDGSSSEMNGKRVDGKKLKVDETRKKKQMNEGEG